MKLSTHADRTEAALGLRAEDIHRWIDGFFDGESFAHFLRAGRTPGFDPYKHRKYRHCAEALEDAYREFEGDYTREQIRAVFEQHLRDDYEGLVPLREDFENGRFVEKYHEGDEHDELEQILSQAELGAYFKGQRSRWRTGRGFLWRIVVPTVVAAVLFAVSSFVVVVPLFRRGIMKQKRQMLKQLASTAVGMVEFYVEQERQGLMSRAEAQRLAAEEVRGLRYEEGNNYFWITDLHPRMVMHPYRPELIGLDLTDFSDRADRSGKKLFVELAELVIRDGEGYLDYLWPRGDDSGLVEQKLSYVRGVPEWKWVVGTGIYIPDVEQEIERLTRRLLLADAVVAAFLFGLLANLVWQSRRIELDRRRAEEGLREAKDRYRALVESSAEGYALEIDGETVYSNQALQRLSGFGEVELCDMKLWDLLDPAYEPNVPVADHLRRIYADTAPSARFDARIVTREGQVLEVQLSTARIFLAEKNGHIISFSRLARSPEEAFWGGCGEVLVEGGLAAEELAQAVMQSHTSGEVIRQVGRLPGVVQVLLAQGILPARLREVIGRVYDATVQRFMQLALAEHGEPPVDYALLSLGSNARHEMTLFSDQDNALVFADPPSRELVKVRQAFLALTDEVCVRLKQAGYSFCSGGIMAANPKWCLSLSEWKACFRRWILDASPSSILEVNVFLDMRCAYGNEELVGELNGYIFELVQQAPAFFTHYVNNGLLYKPPLNLFGHLRPERDGSRRLLNLKECIKPLEIFARIYALKHEIGSPSTPERLRLLYEKGVLQEESFRELLFVFDELWRLRFHHQIVATTELQQVDWIDLEMLTDLERSNLKNVVARIPLFQSRLSYDFLGTQV